MEGHLTFILHSKLQVHLIKMLMLPFDFTSILKPFCSFREHFAISSHQSNQHILIVYFWKAYYLLKGMSKRETLLLLRSRCCDGK